jgi:hypothetical protein
MQTYFKKRVLKMRKECLSGKMGAFTSLNQGKKQGTAPALCP